MAKKTATASGRVNLRTGKPAPPESLREVRDREAVRVTCVAARDMLAPMMEKAKGLRDGHWPHCWLSNTLNHLDLIIRAVVDGERNEE